MFDVFQKISKLCFFVSLAFLLLTATTSKKQAGNQITVRGAIEPTEIKAMIEYYTQYWNLDSLHILVQYTAGLSKELKGYTQYAEQKKWKVRQVIIRINTQFSVKEQWLTLTHEMVHVKQFRRGELIAHGGATYTWKNHHHPNIGKIAYHQRAWEKEAFRLEKKLYQNYQENQRLVARK